jgi:peptide/nickel transport system substrate-binding protein
VVTYLDPAGVRARGPLTVEVPFKIPIADFAGCFAYLAYYVVRPDIYDKGANPIGTGPFKYESFTPGKSSTFVANKDYWGGAPYVDEQVVNSSFTDENARANALLSGSIDILPSMVPALAKANASNSAIYIEHASGSNTFYIQCRVDLAPFKDPRVMVALKMLCDRPQMVESVFSGYADEGNDLIGPGLPDYAGPDVFPIRKYDPEQAKSLLKAAGYDGLTVTQYTSPLSPGWVEGATDYAQQAAKGGVQVKLVNVNPSIYSTPQGPAGGYGKYPMYSDAPGGGSGVPSLTQQSLILFLSTAPYNGNHFGDAQTDKVLLDAVGELDDTKAQEKWTAFQKIIYERGGSIVYGVPNYLDGYGKRVRGVHTTAAGPVNNFNVSKAWLAQ